MIHSYWRRAVTGPWQERESVMLTYRAFFWTGLAFAGLAAPAWAAGSERIDLVEFGRVVELPEEPDRVTTEADELVRGTDGWEAVLSDDGQYTIGVEWEEPREVAEVNIEFRHAIANREQIKVQYWKGEVPDKNGKADGKAAKGRWMTPKAEWWAGDRDVSFSFLPEDKETAKQKNDGKTTRVTQRLRFICGKEDLPPVRYLRAYGPARSATETFDIRFDRDKELAPPVTVRAVNGFIIAGDGKTKMTSAILRDESNTLQIRYSRNDSTSPNRTQLILSPVDKPEVETVLLVGEAAKRGRVQVAKAGVVLERRGGKANASGSSSAPAR